MKLFECQHCGQLLYFENTRCERCGHVLGYLPDSAVLSALTRKDGDRWRPLAAPLRLVRFCANASYDACNWLVPAEGWDAFCRACRHNRTIPDLGAPEHLLRWQRLEGAKHRLIYGLLQLDPPLAFPSNTHRIRVVHKPLISRRLGTDGDCSPPRTDPGVRC